MSDGYPSDPGPSYLDITDWPNPDTDIAEPWAPLSYAGVHPDQGAEPTPGGAVVHELAQETPGLPPHVHHIHHLVHHVVEQMPRGSADYATFVYALGGTSSGGQPGANPDPRNPVPVLDRMDNRRKATIINDSGSAAAIYAGKSGGQGAGNRIRIAAGASLDFDTRAPIYVSCALATDTATVYVKAELNEPNARVLGQFD
jgi:hypothetical protein